MSIDPDTVTVSDVMQPHMVTLPTDASVEKAIETFEHYGISGAPVVDDEGRPCGVVTVFDILRLGPAADPKAGHRPVSEWMTPDLLTIGPEATLGEAAALMDHETVHRVFVADGDRLLGVVSASDVVYYVAKASSAWKGD